MLKRMKGKKGFTLAELLIVVAIIAVLVAIAVPLFVSGLQKAQKARDDANIRSVKSAAVVYILNHNVDDPDEKTKYDIYFDSDSTPYKTGDMYPYFVVTADVTTEGKITIKSVLGKAELEGDVKDGAVSTATGWTITAYVDSLDFEATT